MAVAASTPGSSFAASSHRASDCADDTPLREMLTEDNLPKMFFLFAGMIGLLGWNTILTFTHSFDCDVFGGQAWGGSGWPFWSTLAYSISLNLVSGVLSSRTVADALSSTVRCHLGCLLGAVSVSGLLAVRLLSPEPRPGEDYNSVLVIALVCVFVLAASSAFWQSATFGMAGGINPGLMQALMIGQGIAGVISGVVGLTAGGSQLALTLSFAFSTVLLVVGMPFFVWTAHTNPHMRLFLQAPRMPQELADALSAAGVANSRGRGVSPISTPPTREGAVDSPQGLSSGASSPASLPRRRSSMHILRKSAWPQAFTVCCVMTVTFTVFPGVIARWTPSDRVTLLIATFQLMDVIGRAAPEVNWLKINNGKTVSVLAAMRLAFIPVFLLVQRIDAGWARSAALQFGLMVLFSFTNGYVSTLSMTLGPSQRGLDRDEKEPVGTMMSFFLCLGILLGSLLALPTQIGLPAEASQCGTAGLPGAGAGVQWLAAMASPIPQF